MKEKSDNLFINSFVFDENPIKVIKQYKVNNYFLDNLLFLLEDFVNTQNDMQMLDSYMVEGVYQILDFIKYNYNYKDNQDKNDKYLRYNNLKITLNGSLQANNEFFYISNYLERGMQIDFKYKYTDQQIYLPDDIKEQIRISLCYDMFFYNILTKNRKNISDSELSILTMNKFFIYSVNYFQVDYCEILNNNLVLKQVLLNNKKILGSIKYYLNSDTSFEENRSIRIHSKRLLKEIRWS